MQGMLDQKKSLDTDIEKQKAEQIKINEELATLQENAKKFDSDVYEEQKKELSQELSEIKMTIYQINEYQNTELKDTYHQHQEL